ncbi:MAG: leucine-rich repeat domain-containing protein, partial [Clostridia bacterium]|nr:leucine-rich repeat domain-containing protein [Clostridia bacterium]
MKAVQTSKLIKLIIALAVCFVGVVFVNQVNAATEVVVDSNNYTVTWEYEVEGGKAVNARITKVIDPQNQEIIPREPENEQSQYPELGPLTPPLYRHTYWKIEVPSTLGGKEVISVGDGHTRIINAYDGPGDTYDASVTKVVLPSSIQRINDHAFENVLSIDTINFPNSIKYIGVKAFRNSLLNYGYYAPEFRVPHSLEEIGESAFEIDCNVPMFYGIKNLVIDQNPSTLENYTNLKKIGKRAFARQHIKSIRIPSTVEEVGEDAFWGCKYVDELIIEASNHQLLLKD